VWFITLTSWTNKFGCTWRERESERDGHNGVLGNGGKYRPKMKWSVDDERVKQEWSCSCGIYSASRGRKRERETRHGGKEIKKRTKKQH